MKLYILKEHELPYRFGIYIMAIVAAPDEETAKTIHPLGGTDWEKAEKEIDNDYGWNTWCSSPEFVTATYIGEAKEGTEIGVVEAIFTDC